MPPFLPRKRSTSPLSSRTAPAKRARLADALDAEATNDVPSLKNRKTFSLGSDESSSEESSLSDVDSDQFEDVPVQTKNSKTLNEAEESDEEDDIVWEDTAAIPTVADVTSAVPLPKGPIQITLRNDDEAVIDYGSATKIGSGKKGPSKREKQARILTHQLHVQFLLLHNAIRNNWIEDKKVQEVLVQQLPPQIAKEVDKWRRASGLIPAKDSQNVRGKGKKRRKTQEQNERSQRDWGQPSQRLEVGKADMSHGDPLIMLLKILSAYWKKKFAITAPGLRKRGYGTKHGLKQDIASWRSDAHDPERHGEKIKDLAEFRRIAEKGEGSRDVGAQLFTALLRGLGIEARLIASLQPSGYGWTKVEQMLPRKPVQNTAVEDSSGSDSPTEKPKVIKSIQETHRPVSKSSKRKSKVISLDTDEDDNSEQDLSGEDDESVVDVTPSMPKQQRPKYDRDLIFPVYWTEAISPVTNKVLPVSPLILETPVAATAESLSAFEPKGAKAENGRQVMAYVIAFSADGTAKDVTVRYLRKQLWPGKTKGFRIPVEKVPVYDNRGKVKSYEEYDWFKRTLSVYTRPDTKRTIVDDLEDKTDLVPQQLEKKNDEDGTDTLQSLKSSADYVLERFLRREEALRPGAEPVRTFASGKGDKYKEEAVYRRADVERCLTAESWHKEGRQPKFGETPMKMVPVRAVTLTRKREAEEHERQFGEKQMQGLYAWDQTEYIIPPPIQDGIIPKNAYGNMDCFVPTMVPRGAVHIPLRGTLRICKKLDIDFAEAVTGFEFGNKRAVPVCTGVVVAQENERLVKDAWYEWNEEQRRKEETKMEKLTLDLWRKFILGLRIRERVQDMYGEDIGVIQDIPTGLTRADAIAIPDEEEAGAGGFLDEDNQEEMGGGFLLPHEDETAPVEDLIMDDYLKPSQASDKVEAANLRPSSVSSNGKADDRIPHSPRKSTSDADPESSETDFNLEDKNTATEKPSSDEEEEIDSSDPVQSSRRTNGNMDTSEEPLDEDEDDEDQEEKEIYTPRSTRTRVAKSKTATSTNTSAPAPASRNRKTAKKKAQDKQTEKLSKGTKPVVKRTRRSTKMEMDDDDDDDNNDKVTIKPSSTKRGRGRPRKNN